MRPDVPELLEDLKCLSGTSVPGWLGKEGAGTVGRLLYSCRDVLQKICPLLGVAVLLLYQVPKEEEPFCADLIAMSTFVELRT